MTGKITNEDIYAALQKMQDDIAELKRDSRYVKGEVVALHNTVLGKAVKADARRDD